VKKNILSFQCSYRNLVSSYNFPSQMRCLLYKRHGLFTARRFRRILTEISHTDRLPDDLKRTVIRRDRSCAVISVDYVTLHSRRLTNRERYAARNVVQPAILRDTLRHTLIFSISKARSK